MRNAYHYRPLSNGFAESLRTLQSSFLLQHSSSSRLRIQMSDRRDLSDLSSTYQKLESHRCRYDLVTHGILIPAVVLVSSKQSSI
jgi:hypothetical protein